MNGTSAATPNVAGVVALMSQANPKLSVRYVKHISRKRRETHQTFAGVTANQLVLEQGWTTNAAGWSFSNRYGFGAVDASASVAMAKSYTSYLPAAKISSDSILASAPALVPPQSATGGSLVIPVGESFNTVESVVLYLNVESTPILGCNQIELRSPSGTKSIVLHYATGFQNTSVQNSRIITNAFYGEPVNGNWTLSFFDFCAKQTTATKLSTTAPQTLVIVGH